MEKKISVYRTTLPGLVGKKRIYEICKPTRRPTHCCLCKARLATYSRIFYIWTRELTGPAKASEQTILIKIDTTTACCKMCKDVYGSDVNRGTVSHACAKKLCRRSAAKKLYRERPYHQHAYMPLNPLISAKEEKKITKEGRIKQVMRQIKRSARIFK